MRVSSAPAHASSVAIRVSSEDTVFMPGNTHYTQGGTLHLQRVHLYTRGQSLYFACSRSVHSCVCIWFPHTEVYPMHVVSPHACITCPWCIQASRMHTSDGSNWGGGCPSLPPPPFCDEASQYASQKNPVTAFWVSQYFQKSCFPTMAYCIFCDMSQFTTPPPPHPQPLSGAQIRSITHAYSVPCVKKSVHA